MPSEKAAESACKFLGYDFRGDPGQWQCRKRITQADVPRTDDGLRILAANGSWSEVISLATKLEETAVKNARFCVMQSNEGALVQPATHTAELVARLPYILAQMSSYFKMQRVEKAKELLDALGDIEGDAFLDPITRENLAPFSLRFLSSLIPFYMSNPMETLKRLYKLLDEHENYGPDSFSSLSRNVRRKYEQRVKRIQRALIHVYYSTGKFELAIRTFQKMIEWEEDVENMIAKTKCWSQSKRIRNVLQLQQFACLCLHCGDTVISGKAFNIIAMISSGSPSSSFPSNNSGRINNEDANDESISEASLYSHIINMNEGFKLIVSGKFSEAAVCFRSIAHRLSSNIKGCSHQASLDPNVGNRLMIDVLSDTVLQQLKSNAQTSHCTSLLYCSHEDKASEAFMTEIRDTLEHYLREDPSLLTQSDAFLSDLVRVYALCGERKEKLEQLAGLLEVFRCDAASLPNLEKMV
ncbi:unnamed protein product [Phytomonas sp. EM1]|nr:unnamed protein product [Phytomonas sp. EM1]|eukprot:CCW65119.1 unnamed protein product [Phytomonas sp. isolate EM1]